MSKVRLTGSNSGYVEIAAAADAGNLTFTMPTTGTALFGNGNNVISGITTFNAALDINSTVDVSGASVFNNDVTFDGATSGYDVVWDRSDNQLEFATNAKANFGDAMQLYHNGSNSLIQDSGTGHIQIRSGTFTVGNFGLTKTSAIFNSGAEQELRFNNNIKFVTTNTGVNITGICTATSFSGSGEGLTRTSQFSHRNILINGSCAVSQRGTSFSGTGFTLDRWYVGSGDYSVAQIADAPSNSGLTYSLRVSRTASTTGYLTFQMIELPATGQAGQFYNGAKFTLSGYVKGTSGATITPTLRFSQGTNGSNGSSFTRTEGAFTCNGSWQPFTFHFTVDENVGADDKCVQSYFTFVTTATGQNVFFTGLQLESGEVATPFEHRSLGDELARCKRYFCKYVGPLNINFVNEHAANKKGYLHFPYEEVMRATPTVTFGSNVSIGRPQVGVTQKITTAENIQSRCFNIVGWPSDSQLGSHGDAYYRMTLSQGNANSFINCDAEL